MPTLPKMPSLSEGPPIAVSTGPELDNRRIAAALIDLAVPLLGAAAVLFVLGLSLTRGLLLVAVGWVLYYFFAFESGDGQTLGKRLMKLRVVSADGAPASMEQIAKRTVVRILDGHVVGLVVMLASGDRRQRLGDMVAGTVVTEAEPVADGPFAEDRVLAAELGADPVVELDEPDAEMPPLEDDEPAFELLEHEPTVELEDPDPLPDFDERTPLIEIDDGPHVEVGPPSVEMDPAPAADVQPLIELDHEPVVEVEASEPPSYADEPDPYEELDPAVGHEPLVETEAPAYVEPEPVGPAEPPAGEDPPAPADDEEFTVKPVETVSAIDLVMQDAEERHPEQ